MTVLLHAYTTMPLCWPSITTPQDAHKRLVLQIVEWLTDLLLGLARHDLVQALKSKLKCCHVFTIVCKGREPSAVTQGLKKKAKRKEKCYTMFRIKPYPLDHHVLLQVALHRLFSTLIVYIAPTWHQWGRLQHNCINKQKMHKQTWRQFIFSFSTTFPHLLVNQSFIPGIGATLH